MIIYQVFTRLFGADSTSPVPGGSKEQNGCGTMADFTAKALEEIRRLGCTHIWYTGVIEHATQTDYSAYGIRPDHPDVVKGRAGSPYAIKDYFDIDPDIAVDVENRMQEFEELVDRSHRAGLGVIIDFVPNHVARQYHSDACPPGIRDLGEGDDTSVAFSGHNNFYYIPGERLHLDNISSSPSAGTYVEMPAKATGNDVFSPWPGRNDWYETVKLNYGFDVCGGRSMHYDPIPDTWGKMLQILLFWAAKGIEGFRCDMAEMVPVEFWHWVIPRVKERHPGIMFIAEVYNPRQYRSFIGEGHFDYLYDKVGLYDTLRAVTQGNASSQSIIYAWQSVNDIRGHMLNFLENHDEQRIASDFFAGDPMRGRAALLVSALMNTNPMMIYFGQELGERGMDEEGFSGRDGRTTIFDYWSLDTIRRWRDGGRFTMRRLTRAEQSLRDYYRRVLTLKGTMDLFSKGDFFDVMYVNPALHRQYIFLRRHADEVAVVVANFANSTQSVEASMPEHLFDTWGIEELVDAPATDLLTGTKHIVSLSVSERFSVEVPAWGGVVLRLKVKPRRP